MTLALVFGLKGCVVALLLALGMGASCTDIAWLWKRPSLLARSLLAMYVLVPLAAFAIVLWVPLVPSVKAALLVLAVSAGAPLLPRRLGTADAGRPYAFSLVMTSSLLAIVAVPAWLGLLSWYFGVDRELDPVTVAWALAKAFLLPLALGMVIRAIWPRATRFTRPILRIAGAALIACALLLLVDQWESLARVRPASFAALVAMLLIALGIGHAAGGPDPDDRTALAIACATRHVGIAVLVAGTFPGPGALVLVLAFVLASALVTIPYLRWRRRSAAKREGALAAE